jgi:ligand-binding SRPBCC domain-containing protein
MRRRRLTTTIEVPAPLDEVFPFFSNPQNLSLLTPADFRFQITHPLPVEMHAGMKIHYRVRVLRIPLRWTSEIPLWEPPHRFVDVQLRGPYRYWRHLHEFQETKAGTRILDTIDYAVPGWIFEGLVHRLFVRPDLVRIFQYRLDQIASLFDVVGKPQPPRFEVVPRDGSEIGAYPGRQGILHRHL